MPSNVYFISVQENEPAVSVQKNISTLCTQSGLFDHLKPDTQAVIKMHFGEEGNTGHVKPAYIRVIADLMSKTGAKVTVSDTNTLYKERRTQSSDHMALVREHGFENSANRCYALCSGKYAFRSFRSGAGSR